MGAGRNRLLVASVVATLAVSAMPAATASSRGTSSSESSVGVFAQVPERPGHPFAVLATGSGVYVTTSSGSPVQRGSGEDVVFRYTERGGAPLGTTVVTTMPDMGLNGVAEDADGRLYVVDMNGQILRFKPEDRRLAGPQVYATNPYRNLGWETSMWMYPAFDAAGNLYVTDASQGAIWRIPPNAAPRIWFQDPRLLSTQLSGVNGLAVGPDGKLYVAIPDRGIFRLPVTDPAPAPTQLEVFHAFGPESSGYPAPAAGPVDLAFGRSGKLYVTLATANRIAVLGRDGTLVDQIVSDAFDAPFGVRFDGRSLLVANSSYFRMDPRHWEILKVDVGEQGLPLARPHIPGA